MNNFEYNANPSRVIFGSGSINKLPAEIKRLNVSRPLLLSTPGKSHYTDQLTALLKSASITVAGVFPHAKMHTPTDVTDAATAFLLQANADCVVSIGGGSVIGLGKALSMRSSSSSGVVLPHISIPTTYSGSEMTSILGETHAGKKTTYSDPRILPAVVIYDVDLTLTLPPAMCATSGINALAHAVEALYAPNANPITTLLALEGARALAEALPGIVQDGEAKEAKEKKGKEHRERALYGAWLCGTVLGNSAMGIHHKLAHVLGGTFGLPHAETHTILLPHALAYNAPAIPTQMALLAGVFPDSEGNAVLGLERLLDGLKVPRALRDIGFKESDVDRAVEVAMSAQYPNPRPLEAEPLRELFRRAWAGESAVGSNLREQAKM